MNNRPSVKRTELFSSLLFLRMLKIRYMHLIFFNMFVFMHASVDVTPCICCPLLASGFLLRLRLRLRFRLRTRYRASSSLLPPHPTSIFFAFRYLLQQNITEHPRNLYSSACNRALDALVYPSPPRSSNVCHVMHCIYCKQSFVAVGFWVVCCERE